MPARARAIVKNKADAEDVVQDALERAWRSRDRFTGDDAIPWLLTIMKHVALDALHTRADDVHADLDYAATSGSADSYIERNERARPIAKAMERLSPRYRATFELHDIEGYSNRELATKLQLPYHTVRTRLLRARHQLRAGLSDSEKLVS